MFRVYNIGRPFSADVFYQFYEFHQEFITVCVDCKDKKVYLSKTILKNAKGPAYKLVKKWLIMARSQMLHPPQKKNAED